MRDRDDSELLLTDLAEIAWRRRWWVLFGTNIGLLVAFVGLQQVTPLYTARNSVLVDTQEISTEFVHDVIGGENVVELLMRTIEGRVTSEGVLGQAIDRMGASRFGSHGVAREALIKKMQGGLSVDRSLQQATVFDVSYTATDPDLAADVVTEVTQTFIDDELSHRTRKSATAAAYLTREASQLQRDLLEQEAKIREIEVPGQTALPQGFIERREALAELKAKLSKARTQFTEVHPEVRSLVRQVRELEIEHAQAGDEIAASALSPADANLLRDYDKLVARYHELDNRRLEANLSKRVDEARHYERFRVLQPAYPPKSRSWPDWRFFGAGGLAGGLVLGVLLAGFAEYRNPTFRSVERLGRVVGLPVLASVPGLRANDRRVFEWSLWQRLARSWKRVPIDPLIVTHTAPRSMPAEQYRQVLPAFTTNANCRVVLVTSPGIGDGKSLTCANLAAAVTHDLKRRVLLVDGDLRRPVVKKLLRLEDGPGLSEVVHAGGELGAGDVMETEIPDLWALPAGAAVRNPLKLLGSEEFLKVIEQARSDYDYVFIDSPPLLPVVDTRLLNGVADMVILVVRADRTPVGAVLRALQDLRDVAGIVFNDVPASSYRRYYYDDAYRSYYKARSARA